MVFDGLDLLSREGAPASSSSATVSFNLLLSVHCPWGEIWSIFLFILACENDSVWKHVTHRDRLNDSVLIAWLCA